jgi:hypothetical protein
MRRGQKDAVEKGGRSGLTLEEVFRSLASVSAHCEHEVRV